MVFCHSAAEQDHRITLRKLLGAFLRTLNTVVSGCMYHTHLTLPPFPALAHLPLSGRVALAVSFHSHVLDTPTTVNFLCVGRCEVEETAIAVHSFHPTGMLRAILGM